MIINTRPNDESVGRLFNKTFLPQANDLIDDPYTRPRLTGATIAGGFFPWQEKYINPVVDTEISDSKNPSQGQNRQHCYLPKTLFEIESDSSIGYDFESSEDNHVMRPLESVLQESLHITGGNTLQHWNEERQGCIKKIRSTQSQNLPSAFRRNKRPISQNVTFAGGYEMKVKKYQTDKVLYCEFVDIVEVFYIRRVLDSSQIWYTREENDIMKEAFVAMKREMYRMRQSLLVPGTHTLRLNTAPQNHRYLRKRTIAAVLLEQEKQKRMLQKIYGRIKDSSGRHRFVGILDPERLRNVYIHQGKTVHAQEEALNRANCDMDHHIVIPTSIPSTDKSSCSELYCDSFNDEYSAIDSACSRCCLDLSTTFGECIDKVFSTLLNPFWGRRKGPLFLDIGEELIVE